MKHGFMFGKALLVVTTLAGSAYAGLGDIVFTDEFTDSVMLLADPGGANTVSNLYTFTGVGADFRPGDIIALPGGDYIVANNPLPVLDPSTASIERVTDLFGSPSHWTVTSSDPVQYPLRMQYDSGIGQVIAVNNPGSDFNLPNRFEGILGVDPDTGTVSELYSNPIPPQDPRPRYQAGSGMWPDPFSGLYFHMSNNGGEYFTGDPGDENQGSQIYMFDPVAGTVDLAIDLSFVIPGTPITRPGGIVALPGDTPGWRDVYLADLETDSIYKIRFDDNLDYVDISVVLDGLENPSSLDFNPFTNKLVWASPLEDRIEQANLDGTGWEILATGIKARGFEFIPAPSTIALLGLGGLISSRRRR